MERPPLSLVPGDERKPAAPAPRGTVAVAFLGLAAAAAVATLSGADRARAPWDPMALAQDAAPRALAYGAADPEARAALAALRRRLGERPLDRETRVAYASLVEAAGGNAAACRLASVEASRAAKDAPASPPILRGAAALLAACGEADAVPPLVRNLFLCDPGAGAALLREVEPRLTPEQAASALADDPASWIAWYWQLRAAGRHPEAEALLDRAVAHWPQDPDVRTVTVIRAVDAGRWDDALRLIPAGDDAGGGPAAHWLLAFRARARAARGDAAGATRDAEAALRRGAADPWVDLHAGEALLAAGKSRQAVEAWRAGLFACAGDRSPGGIRVALLERIARAEDRDGAPADALRAWREVLEIAPDHAEARARSASLGGW